jgi:tetratricopeptide (TPR) repeat protein
MKDFLKLVRHHRFMKSYFTLLVTIISFSVAGQSAQEQYQIGIEKHKQLDFKGAIKDYDKAINLDKSYALAYFNRGTCYMALKETKAAMRDFNETIELDPKFAKAYYGRASLYVMQEKYIESLPDLDKTIEFDPRTPNALTLRGQIRAQTGNKAGACDDFRQAKDNGDPRADGYLTEFCGNVQEEGESFVLDWPESENWKLGDSQQDDKMSMLELIHTNETLENWTEIGTMISIKGVKNLGMDNAMNLMYEQAEQTAPKAKLSFIEKDETAEYPWIIFMIEASKFTNDKRPESQLWYIVQGKTSLYTNFRAIKKDTIPEELKTKWIAFFKTGKVVNK